MPQPFSQTFGASLKWSAGLALLLALAMTVVFSVTFWLGTSALTQSVDAALLEQLELLASRPPDLLPFMITSRMNHQPTVITQVGLFDADGKPIVGDLDVLPSQLRPDGKVHAIDLAIDAAGIEGHAHMAMRRLADGRQLAVARDVTGLLQMRQTLMSTLIISVFIAALISLGAGIVFGLRMERRLAGLRHIAGRIVDGALTERLPESGRNDELDQLTAMMNQILERLEASVEAWKNVGEDIAHDLRTPLTAVRAQLERARNREPIDEACASIVERAIGGIDDALSVMTALLRIAEIEKGRRREKFDVFDLNDVIAETAQTFLPLAEDAGVAFDVKSCGSAEIIGDRALIVEAVVNLVDNAIKFAGRGAHVTFELAGPATKPIVSVSDDGPGIPRAERDKIFKRFYRAEPSRSTPGSGLGLALVASIAALHSFGLSLTDNQPGCRFELKCWPQNNEFSRHLV